MVAKPQEHMNKSAERKEGEKRGGGGTEGGVEQNWIFFFTPQVSLYPENVIGLTRGVVVGSLA